MKETHRNVLCYPLNLSNFRHITVSPLPQRCLVQVTFKPRLLDQEIKEEALRRLHRAKLLYESELEGNRLAEQEVQFHTHLPTPATVR